MREPMKQPVRPFDDRAGAVEAGARQQSRAQPGLRRPAGVHALGPGAFGQILDDAARHAAGDAERIDGLAPVELQRRCDPGRRTHCAEHRSRMEARLVRRLRHHQAEAAQHLDAERDAAKRRRAVRVVPLARGEHRRHDHGTCVHRPALKCVIEVLAMRRRAVNEGRACGAPPARMADRRAWPVIVATGKRGLHVILLARRDAQADHVDGQILALVAHTWWDSTERENAIGELLGQRDFRKFAHVLRNRAAPPKPGMRLIAATTAKVTTSMMMPSTAMAPRSPDSFRSKISTEITFVSEVNSMMAAESSRITPTKMKHQVAITLVRSSGAVIWPSACSRVAPRMRLASSRSTLTVRNADWSCW